MKKRILCTMILLILCLTIKYNPSKAYQSMSFLDVTIDHWAYDDIIQMSDKNIINGIGNNNYAPNAKATYSSFLTVMGRIVFKEAADNVQANEKWYSQYIYIADEMDLLKTYDFHQDFPDEIINRYETAQIINQYLNFFSIQLPEYDKSNIKDFDKIPDKYTEAVVNVFSSGIICGDSNGSFSGDRDLSRAEMAAMANRFEKIMDEAEEKNKAVYHLSIVVSEGGTIPAEFETEINGYYTAGSVIHVLARAMPDYRFIQWTTTDGGVFFDKYSSDSSFIMPAKDTVILADFDK